MKSRSPWREQAVAWLEADLAASASVVETGRFPQRAAVNKRLGRWQVDPSLASLREKSSLSGMPEPERLSLQAFWCRVQALREKVGDGNSHARDFSKNP